MISPPFSQKVASPPHHIGGKDFGQDKIVIATISEACFVGVQLEKSNLDKLFDVIHEGFDPSKTSEVAGKVSKWMDQAPQYPMSGGFGHRIFFGHSLSDIKSVYDQEGLRGVFEWSRHMGADFCSPDGLPLPFANFLKGTFDLNVHEAVNALSINVTDSIACGFGVSALSYIPDPTVKALAAAVKLWVGIAKLDATLIVTSTVGVILGTYAILDTISKGHSVDLTTIDPTVRSDPPKGENILDRYQSTH